MDPQRGELVIGEPCDPAKTEPLRVVAHLTEGVVLTYPLMLDALLAWAESSKEQRLPPLAGRPGPLVEIPVMRVPGGQFHLCSQGFGAESMREVRHKHRRSPWQEMARFGTKSIRRVDIAAGPDKSYRVPYSLTHLEQNEIEWWCIGDRERIASLLSLVHYVGKHRGSGKGRLDIHGTPWTVEPCDPWEGFPILRDGLPLRQLPIDWPGLRADSPRAWRPLSYPYFDHTAEEEVACPSL